MLEGLKRLFGSAPAAPKAWEALQPWADSRQYVLREVKGAEGFVLDGKLGAVPWRLEWGASQRHYISGTELRMRAEMGLSSDLQLVLMNKALQLQMEKAVFDQYVEGVQTRIDNQTPPEMRWLVMFPKLAAAEMGGLRERFAALGSTKSWLQQWLEGPLAESLVARKLDAHTPFVLMIGRGRITLRMALGEPEPRDLEPWLRVFETAMREARRVAVSHSSGSETGSPSTQPSLWSASTMPPPGDAPR
jgi:hypothetical protein